ncbi:MAG: membrane protein insertase YidC [Myxococcaceae bacterium]|nr:membrane protein insertase YidC [Myxococcaceae bacterium]
MNPDSPDLKRLFLAVFLMTALLMGYNAFFGPRSKPVSLAESETSTPMAPLVPVKPKAILPLETLNIPITETVLTKRLEPEASIRGGYTARLSSEGAKLEQLNLLGYEKPIAFSPNFSVVSRDSELALSPKSRFQTVAATSDSVTFVQQTQDRIQVEHRYQLTERPFVVAHEVSFKNLGLATRHLSIDLEMNTSELAGHESDQLAVTWNVNNKHHRFGQKDLQEKPEHAQASPRYVGFDRRYFLMSLAPETPSLFQGAKTAFQHVDGSDQFGIRLEAKSFSLSAGATQTFAFSSYLGPKQIGLLQNTGYGLEENIDYGWFGVLSRPLLWLLIWIDQWVKNFGIAIILLTIFIKLLTFPLTQKSFASQQEMKKIAPQLKEIQKKYSHDKAMLGQKQMEFYREKGINPMAGCLPMLIQMPVWFALYQMLGNSVELYEQPFYGWILDLTKPDPYYAFPVLMGVSMLISQLVIPPQIDESQPQMKYVLWFMPLFLTFVMLNLPAGLSLYMLVNNLLTIAQQVYVRRRSESLT